MSIISKPHSFGTDKCLVCNKMMKVDRKYDYVCSVKCLRKLPKKIHRIIIDIVSIEQAKGVKP